MKKRVCVLGCGMVGATIAMDLADEPTFEVCVADVNEAAFNKLSNRDKLKTVVADLSDTAVVRNLIADADLVAGAMPSLFGYQTLKTVVESGKSFVDISFMIEDPTELSDLAKERGVTVVYDCGVAPGLANMAIGCSNAEFDRTENAVYYVGGLPKRRFWPYEYKAPFAPSDVIEEYTRPARMVENGKPVVKPALSEPELLDFPQVGTLEGFNTDGLRSLVNTIAAPNMKEKTLRWPGHCELMRVLRETGLLEKTPIEVDGKQIRPLDLTSKLLFDQWRLERDEEEFTILRVIVEGEKGGKRLRHVYDLYDEHDAATGRHSMARTTAFPAAIFARLIASGEYNHPGVLPPEIPAAEPGVMDRVIAELSKRGVSVERRVEEMA